MARSYHFTVALTLILVVAPFKLRAQALTLTTPRGAVVEVIAELPPGPGPFPAVVLAPGQGYHMNLPAIEQPAKRLLAQGVAVYRFNWAYFSRRSQGGSPSEDLSSEIEDLATVIARVRSEARVDQSKVSVGGKSLGSVVAWRVLREDKSLRTGLFLTPICSNLPKGATQPVSEADENYPGLSTEQRRVSFIAGDRDPLCSPGVLYRFAASSPTPIRVAVVGGDHGFGNRALQGASAEAALARNIDSVSILATNFILDASAD
jgi:predicted alpha/beta-hydrolase family hydrolase